VIVISRRKDQGIVIGDDIVITVTEIQGDDIRLHIERPPGVPVKKRVVGETIEQVAETSPQP
jgi:carbon storage regulator